MSPPFYHLVFEGSAPPIPPLDTAPRHTLRVRVEGRPHAKQSFAHLVRHQQQQGAAEQTEQQVRSL